MQQVGQREVGELQAQLSDDTGLSPSGREFYLVVGFRDEVVAYVHGAVFRLRLYVGRDALGVEVAHLLDFTHGSHQCFAAEELAGACEEFAAYYVLVQAVVTVDADFVDGGLTSFVDAHFQVDGVAHDVHLHGFEVVEEVTVVVVQVADGVVVGIESFVQQLLVVNVALLHLQQEVQVFGCIEGIAHPRHVAQVVLLSFVDLHEYVDGAFVVGANAVLHDHGVAVAQLVVLVDDQLLVGLVVFFNELLGAEQVDEFAFFIGLLHHPFQLLGGEGLVADDGDFVHFHFLLLVDGDIDENFVILVGIVLLGDDDFGVLESLVVEVALDEGLGAVDGVGGDLVTFQQCHAGFEVFAFGFLHAVVADVRHAGTHGQVDGQPDFVSFYLVGFDAYVGEEAVPPVSAACVGDFLSRHGDGLSLRQSRQSDDDIIFIVIGSFYFDVCNLILLGLSRVEDNRHFFRFAGSGGGILLFLCRSVQYAAKEADKRHE